MKKIWLLLVLALFGCQSLTKITASKPEVDLLQNPEQQAASLLDSRDLQTSKFSKKKIRVAIFVPTSGKNKDLGLSLFNAATLSLFDNDKNHNIELVLIDSKDTPEEAQKAFQEVIKRDIKVVIGPVFSTSVEAIEKDAKRNDIAVISFSNNQKLSNKINDDGGIFIAGMLPEAQVDKIVSYAMSRGKFTFSIIAPSNQYGKAMSDIFKQIVRDRDGKFVTSEFYNTNGRDLDKVVANAINAFVIPARLTEGRNKLKKDTVLLESDRTYSQVIMIPESGKALSKIVASINKQNSEERNFQIVGTSNWDDVSTFNDRNIFGAWFAAPEGEKFREFEKRFYQTFDKFPPRITSISYDAMKAIVKLVELKQEQVPTVEDFVNYRNLATNGFEGIDGIFRFLPNGLVQRNLAVLQVANGRFDVIEKPNDKFLNY